MHKLILFLLVVLSPVFVGAQSNMYVHETTGNITPYPIDSIRKLTFPSGQLQIHRVIGDTINFGFPAIRKVTFNALTTETFHPKNQKQFFEFTASSLEGVLFINYITALKGPIILEVYDINGKLVAEEVSFSEGKNNSVTTKILLGDIPSGIYLCQLRGDQFRTVKKFSHQP